MRLEIDLDRTSGVPLHRQIAEEIRTQVLRGTLEAGSRLPTVRCLAAALGTANQTVTTAYRLLREWGTVEATVGRGTFVASDLPRQAVSRKLGTIVDEGPIAEFESISDAAGLRSLATAVPDPWLFHSDELLAEMRNGSAWEFYYAPPEGLSSLRHVLAKRLTQQGAQVSPREILVTHGATHSLSLLVDEFCKPGDRVLVEAPGFLGCEAFFASRRLPLLRVRSSAIGIDLDHLRELTETPASLLLCWPSFGPAKGTLMPVEARLQLLALARKRRFLVVEDAHYAPIAFRDAVPPLAALSTGSEAIQIDSLSGYLSAGLRTGWIMGPASLMERLARRVRYSGAAGAAFLQAAIARYIAEGRLEDHLRRVIPKYRTRRDTLMSSLSLHLPFGTHWTVPNGGLATWLTLPGGLNADTLYSRALERGVAFAPGSMFDPSASSSLRLSYGTQEPATIREAVAILGSLVSQEFSPKVPP